MRFENQVIVSTNLFTGESHLLMLSFWQHLFCLFPAWGLKLHVYVAQMVISITYTENEPNF